MPREKLAEELARTDAMERRHPLIQSLPHHTAHYAIDYELRPDGRLVVHVTLHAILNQASDAAAYEDQLRRYKAEADQFLARQPESPANYAVSYRPPEAARL